jgi:hypothetical protein
MQKVKYIFFLFLILSYCSFAQQQTKSYTAIAVSAPPKIDGLLNEEVWSKNVPITDFVQFEPLYAASPSQKISVWIAYDNNAVYVAAFLYDTSPDSILHQLGNRDDEDLNADEFGIQFDTYNNQSDAYTFIVSASGVQTDHRVSDLTFNAVWQSAARINKQGWCVEMKIPYSALRFPATPLQLWGLEVFRNIRRHREHDQWAPELREAENNLIYWGKLRGIENIKAPLRLSLTPYLGFAVQHYPADIPGKSNYSFLYSGGLDLKYGINESFTLDMTLLPDFSQVQSDNLVKNITPFETQYDENRPFFNEAVDLFKKGDLLYSRRIGGTPRNYYSVSDSLKKGEYIYKNPETSRLINAAKISGRNKNGLAIGFFNALTDNMYADIRDSFSSAERKELTAPLTNYNLLVFDQALKNGSSVTLINTNVIRDKDYDDANVTGALVSLIDASNTYNISANGFVSRRYHKESVLSDKTETTTGHSYSVSAARIKGNFRFMLIRQQVSNTYDANDMSVTLKNNFTYNALKLDYNIYKPFWIIRNMNNMVMLEHSQDYITSTTTEMNLKIQTEGTFMNYLSFWGGGYQALIPTKDYYEPRVPGRFIEWPEYGGGFVGFSSDYRKAFALDGQFMCTIAPKVPFEEYNIWIRPIVRVSDKLAFWYKLLTNLQYNAYGFVSIDNTGNIIMGNRDITEIENSMNARYIFKNDLSLNLRLRHYWSVGDCDEFFTLQQDGSVLHNSSFTGNYDYNFNTFYFEMLFSWQFAPGSSMSIMWKNNITGEDQDIGRSFTDNLKRTFDLPQSNMFSIRVLYYLDYQYLRRGKKH